MAETTTSPPTLTLVSTNPRPVASGDLEQRCLESIFEGEPGEFEALLRQIDLRETPPRLVATNDE